MTKLLKIMLFIGFFILGFSALGFSEDITISTYYPSPMGVYRVLKLDPGGVPGGVCQRGEMYYKDAGANANRIYLCISAGNWKPIGLLSDITAQNWTATAGNDIYNTNGGNVGIGTGAGPIPAVLSVKAPLASALAFGVVNGNALFEKKVAIGTAAPLYTYELEVNGTIQADDYYSQDGTRGLAWTVITVLSNVLDVITGFPVPCTIEVKNGLVTGTTCPP